MNGILWFFVVLVGGVILYAILIYNNLQTIKTRIRASIQEIGNQLKRQADLIPNLAESTQEYLKHEKGIFKQLTDARKTVAAALESGSAQKMIDAQEVLSKALGSLNVIVESNPEIKASEVITKLMNELRDTADKVMYARRTLIDLTADFNRLLVTFPSNMIASGFGFKPEKGIAVAETGEHLEVKSEELKTPKVEL